jgi:hypothetical protein
MHATLTFNGYKRGFTNILRLISMEVGVLLCGH